MKIITCFYLILITLFLTTSCKSDLLDIPQKGVIPTDGYYTEENADDVITAVYSRAASCFTQMTPHPCSIWLTLFNLPSDDIWFGGNFRGDNFFFAQLNEFNYVTNNDVVTGAYRNFYQLIYATNLLITNYEYGINDNIDRYISEARVWRAWAHMFLALWWNNPPLADRLLEADEKMGNTPHDEIMKWVIQEFKDSAPYIPSRKSKADKDGAVRLTKEATYAFLGKAQVFTGKYADAVTNLKDNVINTGLYELVPGEQMQELFHRPGNGNPEKVFEFNIVANPGVNLGTIAQTMQISYFHWRMDKFIAAPTNLYQNGWGGCNPKAEFCESLIANDGMDSYRRKAWILTYDEVLYDLPYTSDANKPTLEDKKTDPLRGVDPDRPLFGHEGYFMWKRCPLLSDREPFFQQGTEYSIEVNLQLMRYAEVLLLYAEACAQTPDASDDADGLAKLRMVQERAGSNYISTVLTLDEVKKEKRFEMWMESTRFLDLRRWGDAYDVLKNNGEKIPSFRELLNKEHPETGEKITKHQGYIDWRNSDYNGADYGFKIGKHEYLPYPYNVISVNPNIVQNPGWE